MAFKHISAMPGEVLSFLDPQKDGIYVDGTLGGAGHARAIMDRVGSDGMVIGIDQDMDAIRHARETLGADNIRLVHGNFADLPQILQELGIDAVNGILIDIGLSQNQLEQSGRGFSFMKDEPLDMRMDTESGTRAEDLINGLDEKELADLFFTLGEERFSRPIARSIVRERQQAPITTSLRLANIVSRAVPRKASAGQKIHPATRVFQALRISVNNELGRLQEFLDHFVDCLKPGGRLCVLSFHSLEDRLVKEKIRELEGTCTCPKDFPVCVCGKTRRVKSLTRKVVRPSEQETMINPMARSTRLRACEKI
ncbi:MAG: 16S rRNA (cytosine(1402)-N(4))-methyltransferase RsmH [Proteobacteria bacterium]|nr:16S rRNA (cytosine(1402)-N(4))-methyltransferase RsmH [Pseudomonadota bacterium]